MLVIDTQMQVWHSLMVIQNQWSVPTETQCNNSHGCQSHCLFRDKTYNGQCEEQIEDTPTLQLPSPQAIWVGWQFHWGVGRFDQWVLGEEWCLGEEQCSALLAGPARWRSSVFSTPDRSPGLKALCANAIGKLSQQVICVHCTLVCQALLCITSPWWVVLLSSSATSWIPKQYGWCRWWVSVRTLQIIDSSRLMPPFLSSRSSSPKTEEPQLCFHSLKDDNNGVEASIKQPRKSRKAAHHSRVCNWT